MTSTTTHAQLSDFQEIPTLTNSVSLIGRVLLSAIFLASGIGKIAAPAATIGYITSVGLPFPDLSFAAAVIVEIVGSVALIAGYRTRSVAAIMALFCLATAFTFHNNFADQNQLIHFLKNVSMTGGLLQIIAFGGGRFSLDGRKS